MLHEQANNILCILSFFPKPFHQTQHNPTPYFVTLMHIYWFIIIMAIILYIQIIQALIFCKLSKFLHVCANFTILWYNGYIFRLKIYFFYAFFHTLLISNAFSLQSHTLLSTVSGCLINSDRKYIYSSERQKCPH